MDSGEIISAIASTLLVMFGRPLLFASSTHSCEYPFPLKRIRLWFLYVSVIILRIVSDFFFDSSISSANSLRIDATIVFITVFGFAIDADDPTILNSNLFPVNAIGEVLFLSVESLGTAGSEFTPNCILPIFADVIFSCLESLSRISSNSDPKKIEMMDGGASAAPRR